MDIKQQVNKTDNTCFGRTNHSLDEDKKEKENQRRFEASSFGERHYGGFN